MGIDAILNQPSASNTQQTSKTAEDKDMFLKLLVAQLSNQDPLSPVEDKEFIAQLAQFTQVEEMQKLNDGMSNMVAAYDREQFVTATNLLGQTVLSGGSTLSKVSNKKTGEFATTTVYFTSDRDMSNCTVNVHGPGGYILYSEDYGARQAGSYTFSWDGTGPSGMIMPDGVYEFSVTATDVDGRSILTTNQVAGQVVQVERTEDSRYLLHLYDGRNVNLEDVSIAGYVINQDGETPPDDTENGDNQNGEDPEGTDPETGSDPDD